MTEIFQWARGHLVDALDIYIITYLIYRLILMLKGTRAVRILVGLVIIILSYFAAQALGLVATTWLLSNFLLYAVLIVVIIFQGEIRRALWEVGRSPFTSLEVGARHGVRELEESIRAVQTLADRKVGALIAIERTVGLRTFVEGGVQLDSAVTKDLLVTIFLPNTPLHDGAVIIQKWRVAAAGCLLPLSHDTHLDPELGTRHRAAVGLTEESDAIVLVVSEERGKISLAVGGELRRGIEVGQLREELYRLLASPMGRTRWWASRSRMGMKGERAVTAGVPAVTGMEAARAAPSDAEGVDGASTGTPVGESLAPASVEKV